MDNTEEFLTLKEFAKLMRISVPTLWRLRKEGVVNETKMRGAVRIHRSEADKLRAAQARFAENAVTA